MTRQDSLTLNEILVPAIKKAGGWVNVHTHADKAFTLNEEMLDIRKNCTLQEKWDRLDRMRRESTEEDFYASFSRFFEHMIAQGCTAVGTCVDVEPSSGDRALKAGIRAREHYKDQLTVKLITQTLKGIIEPESRRWFELGAELGDIIGGVPMRDENDWGKGREAFDIMMTTAKEKGKYLQLHVDQFNNSWEYETEMLCRKTIEYGMQGKVTAVHCISVGAHTKRYRERLYALMKEAGVSACCCATSWLDTRRTDRLAPWHNAITPVEEMLPFGINVCMGTDNVSDAMCLSGGDLWTELYMICTACHYDNIEDLVNLATVNGRKSLGIE